jgi:hypothetical protein
LAYFINKALNGLNEDHEETVIDEDQVSDDDSPCSFDISEVADGGVDGVESVAGNVQDEVV